MMQILCAVELASMRQGTLGAGQMQEHTRNSKWRGRETEPKQRQNINQHNAKGRVKRKERKEKKQRKTKTKKD